MHAQKGFSLIEVTISMLVLGLLAVSFLQALSTANRTRNQANVRTTAVSLADGQMEKIKAGQYNPATGGTANYTATIAGVPNGYRFATLGVSGNPPPIDDQILGFPWDVGTNQPWSSNVTADPGIQKITIIVQSSLQPGGGGVYKDIYELVDFKVNR
jgi:prepilin-type N-terminal cleavage/methylation domain-containing protein